MNDNHRTPEPDDLTDLDGLDPVVVGQLRRTLQAVAAATPTEDRSAALLTAIDTRPAYTDAEPPAEEPAMELDRPSTTRPPIWRRPAVLAAAAAVTVVALIAGVGLATQDDDRVEIDPAEDGGLPAPTGWFVPPEGWDIAEVRTDFLDVGTSGACPCRTLIAAEDGEQPVALVVRETAGPVEGLDGAVPIDVGGRPGQITDVGSNVLAVGSGEHHLVLIFAGVDPLAVLDLADAWLDRREAGEAIVPADLPLPDALVAGELVDVPARRSVNVVDVLAVERSTGRRTYYQVVPAGAFYSALVIGADRVAPRGERFEVLTTVGTTPMAGLVGGPVDLVVGPSYFAEEGDDLTVDELRLFLGGLREVSTDDWRAAIEGAVLYTADGSDFELDPAVMEAETLFETPLVDGPDGG